MEQLAALDHAETWTVPHVAQPILHDLFELTGENPEMNRLAIATIGAKLVGLSNGLGQGFQRSVPQCSLELELREQTMMGHGNLRVAVIGDDGGRGAERRVTGTASGRLAGQRGSRFAQQIGGTADPVRRWAASLTMGGD